MRACGIALLAASALLWLFVLAGLATRGLSGRPAGPVLGGLLIITAPPIALGMYLEHAGRRGRSAFASGLATVLAFIALAPFRLARTTLVASFGVLRWAAGGGPRRVGTHLATSARDVRTSIAAAPPATMEAARTRINDARAERARRRAEQAARDEASDRARTERRTEGLPAPIRLAGVPALRSRWTLGWLVESGVTSTGIARTFVIHSRSETVAFALLLTILAALPTAGVLAAPLFAVPAAAFAFVWWHVVANKISEVRFEPGLVRFLGLAREVIVLPGEVTALTRTGGDDGDEDDRQLLVATAMSGTLHVDWFAGIDDLEACLRAWNPDAALTGRWHERSRDLTLV